MKILLSIAFLVIAGKVTSQSIPVDSIIQRSSLFNTISVLAHDSMRGRATGSRAELKAANFIAERFKETGLKPVAGNDGFFAFFPFKIFDTVQVYGINVMGALKGNESADSIVISAPTTIMLAWVNRKVKTPCLMVPTITLRELPLS